MMASMETYLRRGELRLRRWLEDPVIRRFLQVAGWSAAGFFLSAAEVRGSPQPLAPGLILALGGWQAAATCFGAVPGYLCFWGQAGYQGITWSVLGAFWALLSERGPESSRPALGRSAMAAFLVSATGLLFQVLWEDKTSLFVYLLRIAVAAASTALFYQTRRTRDAILGWVAGGTVVLALAPVMPVKFLGFGYIAGAMLSVSGAFPGAALAGMGLDLARVTPIPMAAVLCVAYFSRMGPPRFKWLRGFAPACACLLVMLLCGIRDPTPLPGLLIGGFAGLCLPAKPELAHRRGETGLAQVRLEMSADVLAHIQQLLLETDPIPIDEEALLTRAKERACACCSARSACREQETLTTALLHHPLSFQCRKTGRIAGELRRAQEQLRSMRADRERQRQYRWAVIQQYQFLSDFLRNLADQLPRRGDRITARFRVEVSARSVSKEQANGDKCTAFSGAGCKYYVLLCDGMGTGLGAARKGSAAAALLRKMLTAGYPAEYAFRSLNSTLTLRGEAGAVTLDLAEIRLDSGRISLYKWGAAPSWILRRRSAEKIGTATAPPGISVTEMRETVTRLSLRRGEVLVLLSDGVEVGDVLRRKGMAPDAPPGELAERLLELGGGEGEDDATAAVIRLSPLPMAP